MSMVKDIALVALGGGAGSVLRYALTAGAVATGLTTPAGTLCANVLGCVAGGVLLGAVPAVREASDPWRLLLIVGFLGGLTTFSAFSIETFHFLRDGKTAWAFANIGANLALGLGGVWAGYALARQSA